MLFRFYKQKRPLYRFRTRGGSSKLAVPLSFIAFMQFTAPGCTFTLPLHPGFQPGPGLSGELIRITLSVLCDKGILPWTALCCQGHIFKRCSPIRMSTLAYAAGKVSVTLNRSPSRISSSVPCWTSIKLLAMFKPRPLPSRFREASPRTKRSISSSAE